MPEIFYFRIDHPESESTVATGHVVGIVYHVTMDPMWSRPGMFVAVSPGEVLDNVLARVNGPDGLSAGEDDVDITEIAWAWSED